MCCRRCLASIATLRTTFTLRYSVLYHPVGAFCGRTWLREGAVENAKFQRFGLAASPERYLVWSCSRCLTARVIPFCDWSRLASRLESLWLATGVALPRDRSRFGSRLESPCRATGVAGTSVKGGENCGFGKAQSPPRAEIVCTFAARFSHKVAIAIAAFQLRRLGSVCDFVDLRPVSRRREAAFECECESADARDTRRRGRKKRPEWPGGGRLKNLKNTLGALAFAPERVYNTLCYEETVHTLERDFQE